MTYAGVELGGTKCVALLARGPGEVLERETVATTSPGETLSKLAGLVAKWRFEALGIASFGRFVLDPRRVERSAGPENDNGVRILERLFYFSVKT